VRLDNLGAASAGEEDENRSSTTTSIDTGDAAYSIAAYCRAVRAEEMQGHVYRFRLGLDRLSE